MISLRQLLFFTCLLLSALALGPTVAAAQSGAARPTDIMVVGFDHLNQLYNNTPQSDVLGAKKQAELARLRARLAQFRPQQLLVEATPQEQPQLDSLYALYQSGQLALADLPGGRSERYQVGFALSKELGLPAPRGVDFYAATSQSLLSTGRHIEAFRADLGRMQTTFRPLKRQVQHDSLAVDDYIALANHPAMIALSHRAIFNTPAQVTGGTFSATGQNTLNAGPVDTAYIGAHYISLFYTRNLKIYSNILRTGQQRPVARVMVLMGQPHVGVLQELLAANPAYRVVPAARYLKAPAARARQIAR